MSEWQLRTIAKEFAEHNEKVYKELNAMSNTELLEEIKNSDKGFILQVIRYAYEKIDNLQQENNELKSQLKGSTHCFDEVEHKRLNNKYDIALNLLVEYNMPCEIEDFMNKNTDYCSMNCGVDDESYKKCWDKFIENKLQEILDKKEGNYE